MKNINTLFEEYTQAALEHGKALASGDHKITNKAYAKLTRIYKKLEKDHVFAETILNDLLQHDNYLVRICAAAHALGLNISVDNAQNILDEISKRTDIGIIRLEAEMTLKEWRKKGELKF